MRIIVLPEIEDILNQISIDVLVSNQELGFVAYSKNEAVVPAVGHLEFHNPPGECHIKYGYIRGQNHFVTKIATGFYENLGVGLPQSDGTTLLFDQRTGILEAIMLDNGFLTHLRTALAGLIVAKYLAPEQIKCIGIVGTGIQSELQPLYLKSITNCRDLLVYGRSSEKTELYKEKMRDSGFSIQSTRDISSITNNCNLIVTATASTKYLLSAENILPGTHITSLGSDSPGKQELDPLLLRRADICVVDSIAQCSQYGEVSFALNQKLISVDKLVELGKIISLGLRYRQNENQITVADLTGIATQDIQIASLIHHRLSATTPLAV